MADVDDEIQDELRGSLDVQARLLYGLIHARWIVTARGLSKMVITVFSMYPKRDQTHMF
jgi:hypothetical protein